MQFPKILSLVAKCQGESAAKPKTSFCRQNCTANRNAATAAAGRNNKTSRPIARKKYFRAALPCKPGFTPTRLLSRSKHNIKAKIPRPAHKNTPRLRNMARINAPQSTWAGRSERTPLKHIRAKSNITESNIGISNWVVKVVSASTRKNTKGKILRSPPPSRTR